MVMKGGKGASGIIRILNRTESRIITKTELNRGFKRSTV